MDCYLFYCFFVMIQYCFAADVTLIANNYMQKGESLKLNCSAEVVPEGHTAEFLVNNKTVTNIRQNEGTCFNTITGLICKTTSCACGSDLKSYSMFYQSDHTTGNITIMCKMKFSDKKVVSSNTVDSLVVDIATPVVYILEKFPLVSESFVHIVCVTEQRKRQVYFSWECGYRLQNHKEESNDTSIWSILELKVDSKYDGRQCICNLLLADFNFSLSGVVTLKIISVPILSLSKEIHCNTSKTITLVCTVRGELFNFGFSPWIHTVNGTYIRSLNGHGEMYASVLIISYCTFEDAGEYMCSVWSKHLNGTMSVNESTILQVYGPPIIRSKTSGKTTSGLRLLLLVYSPLTVTSVQCYCSQVRLQNVTGRTDLEHAPMKMDFYGKSVTVLGFRINIVIQDLVCSRDRYSVCISNGFTVCEKFYTDDKLDSSVFWIILGVVVTIVFTGIATATVVFVKRRRESHVKSNSRTVAVNSLSENQYLSAQPYESDIHHYDSSRPYVSLAPYQTTRLYTEPSINYLEVLQDSDNVSTQSGRYEKVD